LAQPDFAGVRVRKSRRTESGILDGRGDELEDVADAFGRAAK